MVKRHVTVFWPIIRAAPCWSYNIEVYYEFVIAAEPDQLKSGLLDVCKSFPVLVLYVNDR